MTLQKDDVQTIVNEMQATSLFPINLDLSIKRVDELFNQIGAALTLLDTEANGIEELLKHVRDDIQEQTQSIDTLTQKTNLLLSSLLQTATT